MSDTKEKVIERAERAGITVAENATVPEITAAMAEAARAIGITNADDLTPAQLEAAIVDYNGTGDPDPDDDAPKVGEAVDFERLGVSVPEGGHGEIDDDGHARAFDADGKLVESTDPEDADDANQVRIVVSGDDQGDDGPQTSPGPAQEGVGALKPDSDGQIDVVDLSDVGAGEYVPPTPEHTDELPEDVKARMLGVGISRPGLDRMSVEFGQLDTGEQQEFLGSLDGLNDAELAVGLESFVDSLLDAAVHAAAPDPTIDRIINPFGELAE